MKNGISIIIRTRNEERWITKCLTSVFDQINKDFEVIIVDNNSTDKTIEKVNQFPIKEIINCKEYLPGKALNIGIEKAQRDFIVCLSGHCIPSSVRWLDNLLKNFYSKEFRIAGVYGRQEPMSFTSDADKRDLALAFGLDRKVQLKDSFFHNANSMIRKEIWKEIPFDETVTNIEDRVWAKGVLQKGFKIIYEPEASVYHYHGIHQNGDEERCKNVVRILENLYSDFQYKSFELEKLNIVAIIPVKGAVRYLAGKPLLAYTIQRALESKYIKKIIVSTDNPELARIARELRAEVPFIREESLSKEDVALDRVLQYSLNKIEDLKILPDLIVTLEITFPFRPKGLIDNMIVQLMQKGFDSVIAAKPENRSIWKERENSIAQLDDGLPPRQFKDPTFIELRGVACITHPEILRKGHLLGERIGIYEVRDPYSHLEVRDGEDFELASLLINRWFK